ncbi:hypothetical protein EA661_12950 [Pseudoxanthomonas winnipegensis]|uniref:Uncharacterized protein n=1 Tax=Pseudoxanthomonas winnipegensis TaxID=2480810 RepID=A0A4Q8LEM1_9GAMM|nr:hypothetical protein [Pseudoxanthomonas winnipegensis]TAA27657.1 hypothetical protein EA661_12950 [Pseudoxanthomonas winnipegensis]
MRTSTKGLIAILVSAALAAKAEAPNSPAQPQDNGAPEVVFLGLKIGASFDVPECPSESSPHLRHLYNLSSSNFPCWIGYAPGQHGPIKDGDLIRVHVRDSAPDGTKSVYAKISGGTISALLVGTDGFVHQEALLDALIAKFGKPENLTRENVKAGSGAEFKNVVATWNKPHVIFQGLTDTINEGMITIYSDEGHKSLEETSESRKKSF